LSLLSQRTWRADGLFDLPFVAAGKLTLRVKNRLEGRMKPFRFVAGLLLVIGTCMVAGRTLSGQSQQSTGSAAAAFPKDVYANTGNRLAAIKREDLDDAGKKLFDARGPVDSFGPGAIRLYSLPVAEHMEGVNDFLRHKSGLDPRLVELAILVTAREMDSEYVWTAHEPQGLKLGLPPATVDIVRFRKSTEGLPEKDAVIIQLGRETIGKHHSSSDVSARALNLFGKQGAVNYVSLMGDYAATAILLNAFDQHVRPTDKPLLPIPK
jgi:4-carboxymuconolactone decarboxylase